MFKVSQPCDGEHEHAEVDWHGRCSVRASRLLHDGMLACVLHSPMSFFDTTPLGRIVNRFSKGVS
jgi:ABC-type multidrug transport system fused ATPase/permease subunit